MVIWDDIRKGLRKIGDAPKAGVGLIIYLATTGGI